MVAQFTSLVAAEFTPPVVPLVSCLSHLRLCQAEKELGLIYCNMDMCIEIGRARCIKGRWLFFFKALIKGYGYSMEGWLFEDMW